MSEVLRQGTCAPRLRPVRDAFDAFLAADPGFSAQLCAYVDGLCVLDLVGGPDLGPDDVTGVFSVTKGVAALALATVIDSRALELDATVSTYWPEFAAQGKGSITVRQLLTHQAGLPAPAGGVTQDDVLHSKRGAARLAAAAPLWNPGSMFGYHGLTIGILMEELARRTTGRELQSIYDTEVREVYGIDFYLGLPAGDEERYRALQPPRGVTMDLAEITAPSSDSLADAAFGRLLGPADDSLSAFGPNTPEIRRAGPAASGGTGSARGLARLYAAALGQFRRPFVSSETLDQMARLHVRGHDVVVEDEMRFGVVFMKPQPRMPFGSYRAFGHDGAGGALAFADPLHRLAFAYIPAPMTTPAGADSRAIELSRILRSCL